MPPKKDQVVASFDQLIQANRKERNAKLAQEMLGTDPKKLAQEMLGKNRRSQTPRGGAAPASLASRVGVNKRSNSLPRPNSASQRNPRQPPPASRLAVNDARPKAVARTASEINIRGVANGPYIVRASNFAPGTSAEDIASVMSEVGGMLNYCKLVAQNPTVIAEMEFVDKVGADLVIQTFNNKKADGRVLYVYYARDGGALPISQQNPRNAVPVEQETIPTDDTMEVDGNAEEREAQDRLRAERRGRDDRGPRNDRGPRDDRAPRTAYPSGPGQKGPRGFGGDYDRGEPQDQRYGYGGGRGGRSGGGYRGNGGGMYSDNMRRGGGGQGYRQ